MPPRLIPRWPPDGATDPEAVPLAVPAVVLASIMLLGMLVALVVMLPDWARDYGAGLVYFAVVIYSALAVRLLWWGLAMLRARVPETDEEGAMKNTTAATAPARPGEAMTDARGTKDLVSRAERPYSRGAGPRRLGA
ncbi:MULTISPECIES: hypothetical protein [Nocardia]|uniref:hypothetical protein n=1 Tax=Nocardia TaxID=1817 RepID=UPI002492A5DE|nr:hypothetical protein [Nocardia sputorum]